MARTAEQDKVRELQRTLYRAAKADPERRFHALSDKVHRRDVLERAWVQVRRNSGAAGIDRTTISDVEEYGVSRLLDELAKGPITPEQIKLLSEEKKSVLAAFPGAPK